MTEHILFAGYAAILAALLTLNAVILVLQLIGRRDRAAAVRKCVAPYVAYFRLGG